MLIVISNYYHIRANGALKLSVCIYNFSGRIYMTNHQQLTSCQIITLYSIPSPIQLQIESKWRCWGLYLQNNPVR